MRAISGGWYIPLLNCQHPSWLLVRPFQSWFWFNTRLFRNSYPWGPKHNKDLVFMHCLCPKSLKKEDIFFILQKPKCCKGFFGPDCRLCPGGFSKPCSGKGQVSRASSSIQLLWDWRISCVLKVPGAFLQKRNVGLHKGYPLHLCPVMAVNSRFSYRWEGKPICHLSDAQIADF